MPDNICWVVYGDKTYFLEMTGHKSGILLLSIDGSAGHYLTVPVDGDERAEFMCGRVNCRVEIGADRSVNLWAGDDERPPLTPELAAQLRPHAELPNLDRVTVIILVGLTLLDAIFTLLFETNPAPRLWVPASLILTGAFFLLWVSAKFMPVFRYLACALLIINTLFLLVTGLAGGIEIFSAYYDGWLTRLLVRIFHLAVVIACGCIAFMFVSILRSSKRRD